MLREDSNNKSLGDELMLETYVIHVTKDCNCDCTYCYEKDKTTRYRFDDLLKYAQGIIDKATEPFNIEFLGGEPMLEWHYIQALFVYFSNNTSLFRSATITSNGTILRSYMLNFLIDNPNLRLSISIDGNKFANQLRVFKDSKSNTYDTVVANIEQLVAHNVDFGVHYTTHRYNVNHIVSSTTELYTLGVRYIAVGTIESTMTIDELYCIQFVSQMKKLSDLIKMEVLPDLKVGQFEWLKPKSDVRTYIRDANGAVIGETYGRVDNIISEDDYAVQRCETKTDAAKMIYNIREEVYNYHNNIN